jgi:hypothetical protein
MMHAKDIPIVRPVSWLKTANPTCPHFETAFKDASVVGIEIGALATTDRQNYDTYLSPTLPITIWQRCASGGVRMMDPVLADTDTLRALAQIVNWKDIWSIVENYTNHIEVDEEIDASMFRMFFMRSCTIISPDSDVTGASLENNPQVTSNLGEIIAAHPQSGHEKLSVSRRLDIDARAHLDILNTTRDEPLVYGSVDLSGTSL